MFHTLARLSSVWRAASRQLVPTQTFHTCPALAQMDLKSVVAVLEELAPTKLAGEWDNVGLLVEPNQSGDVEHVFLTNDLTEVVMEEIESLPGRKVGLIVAYHPPIFHPLKRLTQHSAKERIILRAIERRIAIYSPHTACDSAEGGVNDWLASGLGDGIVSGLKVTHLPTEHPKLVTVHGVTAASQLKDIEDLQSDISGLADVTTVPSDSGDSSAFDVVMTSTERAMPKLLPLVRKTIPLGSKITTASNPQRDVFLGPGRLLTLATPIPLTALVSRVKAHLGLPHVRLAIPPWPGDSTPTVTTIAVCAGSGASVLLGVEADCYLAGEMSHHDVLEAVSTGTAVILTEHSNTERGYLHVFKQRLETSLGAGVEVTVSKVDRDPIQVA